MADIPEGPPTSWGWVGYVVPVLAALGVAWAAIKGYFQLVTRTELKEALDAMQKANDARYIEMQRSHDAQHAENSGVLKEIFARTGNVEKSVSRIEGELSGRFKAIGQ